MLSELAKSLEAYAPGPILTLRCVSGHPLYIVVNDRVPSGDVKYNWTNTNLPLLEIGLPITDRTKQKCIAMLYTLQAHGLGVPIPAHLETPYCEALETCALVRGHERFLQDHHVTPYLPEIPSPVRSLITAITTSQPSPEIYAGHRMAAVMISANVFPMLRAQLGDVLGAYFPGLEHTTAIVRTAGTTVAADEMMRWLGVSAPNYTFRRDRRASARMARVHPLDTMFEAMLSSTRTNRKDFNLELQHLREQMHQQWGRPYIELAR